MIRVKLENEHGTTQGKEKNPLNEIGELLWEAERRFNQLQNDYAFGDELFQWYLLYVQEIRNYRRIVSTTTALTER